MLLLDLKIIMKSAGMTGWGFDATKITPFHKEKIMLHL